MDRHVSALVIPGNTVASYSDLGKHSQCKRAWYWGTYLKLKSVTEPQQGALPFGSRIHQALEAYYDGTVETPVEAWGPLMEHAYAIAAAQGTFTDGLDKENKLGHTMLDGYLEWSEAEGTESRYKTISVETALTHLLELVVDTGGGDLEPVTVLVRGKIDRRKLDTFTGAVYVDDFKTTASGLETALADLVRSPQPRLYLMLEKQSAPEDQWSAGFIVTLLRKVLRSARATPPFYYRHIQSVSPVELDMYQRRLEGSIADLVTTQRRLDRGEDPERAAHFSPGWWCKTCPFKDPCLIRQDNPKGSDAMLADLYEQGDPWARYMGDPTPDTDAVSQS